MVKKEEKKNGHPHYLKIDNKALDWDDSLTDSRISEGDLLLIDPDKPIEHGNCVFTKIGDKLSVRRFWDLGDRIVLQGLNPYRSIIDIIDKAKIKKFKLQRVTGFLALFQSWDEREDQKAARGTALNLSRGNPKILGPG